MSHVSQDLTDLLHGGRRKYMTLNENEKANSSCNGQSHVTPVTSSWPPAWLAALEPPEEQFRGQDDEVVTVSETCNSNIRGWRLPSGVVICARCHPRPPNSTDVVLNDAPDGLCWIERHRPATLRRPRRRRRLRAQQTCPAAAARPDKVRCPLHLQLYLSRPPAGRQVGCKSPESRGSPSIIIEVSNHAPRPCR